MALIGRFIRLLIFVLGVGIGVGGTLFAIDNQEAIPVSIWTYTFHVQVYALALVPLAAGLAIGWLYTVPARTQEFAEHWRSWRALRKMEKENKQLRRSLDRVLELPDEEAPALKGKDLPKLKAAGDDHALEAEPVIVHEVKTESRGRSEPAGEADLPAELADLEPVEAVEPAAVHADRARPKAEARAAVKAAVKASDAKPPARNGSKPHAEAGKPAPKPRRRRARPEAKPAAPAS